MDKLYRGGRSFAERVEKANLKTLRQIRHALTEKRAISRYAEWPNNEVQNALQLVDAALLVLEPKPKKRRLRAKKEPMPLDMSWSYEADLFADLSRWPKRPYCTDDFESGRSGKPSA